MDLAVIETGNGGDLQQTGNDLAMVFGIENMVYLALFGGNPGYPTKNKVQEEQSFDWWGNNLFMPGNQSIQFNSLTEKKLQDIALTSSGRIELEGIIKKDLAFLSEKANIKVDVSIVSHDHIQIKISIVQNDNSTKIKIVNFRKHSDGDFRISDFNDDFYL